MIRRGGAFALVCALAGALGGACKTSTATPIPPNPGNLDAAVYQECDSVCIRPTDCAQTYNDDGICPPGFLCAFRFNGCHD